MRFTILYSIRGYILIKIGQRFSFEEQLYVQIKILCNLAQFESDRFIYQYENILHEHEIYLPTRKKKVH